MTRLAASIVGACLVLLLAAPSPVVPAVRRPIGTPGRTPAPPPRWLERAMADLGRSGDSVAVWNVGRPLAAVALAAMWLALGLGPVLISLALLGVAPRLLRAPLRRRRSDQRDALLASTLDRLASALRAGDAPGPAFMAVAAGTPEPLGPELRRVADEVRHGAGLADALDRWAAAPDASAAVVLGATALALGVSTGGEVARSADRVAATIRERREVQAEARALATQARSSAVVLALAPVAFTLLVASVEPAMGTFLVTTPEGLSCLVGGLGLEALGALWMARIMARAT
ncbi:MAG: type II secretion system F family protein [Acidimicrobiales bacterium]